MPTRIKTKDVEDGGKEVELDGRWIGFIFPGDGSTGPGWRPYSVYGQCLTCGRPAHKTTSSAIGWFMEE